MSKYRLISTIFCLTIILIELTSVRCDTDVDTEINDFDFGKKSESDNDYSVAAVTNAPSTSLSTTFPRFGQNRYTAYPNYRNLRRNNTRMNTNVTRTRPWKRRRRIRVKPGTNLPMKEPTNVIVVSTTDGNYLPPPEMKNLVEHLTSDDNDILKIGQSRPIEDHPFFQKPIPTEHFNFSESGDEDAIDDETMWKLKSVEKHNLDNDNFDILYPNGHVSENEAFPETINPKFVSLTNTTDLQISESSNPYVNSTAPFSSDLGIGSNKLQFLHPLLINPDSILTNAESKIPENKTVGVSHELSESFGGTPVEPDIYSGQVGKEHQLLNSDSIISTNHGLLGENFAEFRPTKRRKMHRPSNSSAITKSQVSDSPEAKNVSNAMQKLFGRHQPMPVSTPQLSIVEIHQTSPIPQESVSTKQPPYSTEVSMTFHDNFDTVTMSDSFFEAAESDKPNPTNYRLTPKPATLLKPVAATRPSKISRPRQTTLATESPVRSRVPTTRTTPKLITQENPVVITPINPEKTTIDLTPVEMVFAVTPSIQEPKSTTSEPPTSHKPATTKPVPNPTSTTSADALLTKIPRSKRPSTTTILPILQQTSPPLSISDGSVEATKEAVLLDLVIPPPRSTTSGQNSITTTTTTPEIIVTASSAPIIPTTIIPRTRKPSTTSTTTTTTTITTSTTPAAITDQTPLPNDSFADLFNLFQPQQTNQETNTNTQVQNVQTELEAIIQQAFLQSLFNPTTTSTTPTPSSSSGIPGISDSDLKSFYALLDAQQTQGSTTSAQSTSTTISPLQLLLNSMMSANGGNKNPTFQTSAPILPQTVSSPTTPVPVQPLTDNPLGLLNQLLQLGSAIDTQKSSQTPNPFAPAPGALAQPSLDLQALLAGNWLNGMPVPVPTTQAPPLQGFDLASLLAGNWANILTTTTSRPRPPQPPPAPVEFTPSESVLQQQYNIFANQPQPPPKRKNGLYYWFDLNAFLGQNPHEGPMSGVRPKIGQRDYFLKVK